MVVKRDGGHRIVTSNNILVVAIAKDAMKKDEGPSTAIRERCRSDGDVPENDEQAARHYALFAGGDWHGMKKWQKR
ncbi:hypothetical protein Hanom_Chr06g00482951 [Helianthus anomalus]